MFWQFGMLGILFVALKLLEKIDWSWWYVLMPLYLPLAIALTVFFIVFGAGLLVDALE